MTQPDPDQLRELYASHRQGLFTLALSITRRQERAEDAVHDAFASLCRSRHSLPTAAAAGIDLDNADGPGVAGGRGVGDPVAYVYRAVRNAAIDHVRRYWPGGNRTVTPADLGAGPSDSGPDGDGRTNGDALFERPTADRQYDPEARSIGAETAAWVARSVERLPDEQREAVVLRVYGGLTFEQIAAVVRAPLPTVAARYRRALDRLRPHLEHLR